MKKIVFIGVTIIVAGCGLYWLFKPVPDTAKHSKKATKTETVGKTSSKAPKTVKPKLPTKDQTKTRQAARVGSDDAVVEWYDELPTAKDRETAKKIQDALDNEDLAGVKAMVDAALLSDSSEVRQHVVDALGWFDQKAIADLTKFLSDKDPDVAQSAFNHWDSAIDMVENESFKLTVAKEAMKSLKDPDMLENVATKLKSAENEPAAVDAVLDILNNVKPDSAAAASAKEAYEFVTGEEFTTVGAAALWKVKRAQEIKESQE